jgi:hypothetical protein
MALADDNPYCSDNRQTAGEDTSIAPYVLSARIGVNQSIKTQARRQTKVMWPITL